MHQANSPSKILVIDDNEVVLEATRATLEAAGHAVVTHDRAAGCVALILQEKPSVVLMDVNMPRLAGDTVLGVLRKAQPTSEMVMLLYSSLPAEILRVKAEAVGAHGYIQKSADAYSLLREVNRWLKYAQRNGARTRPTTDLGLPSGGRMRVAPDVGLPSSGRLPLGPDSSRSVSGQAAAVSDRAAPREEEPYASGSHPIAGTESGDGLSSGTMPSARPGTVLLIDRDMSVLSAYRNYLHSDHLRVEYALSGSAALRSLLSQTPPDLAVCDAFMSDLSGMELYRRALAGSLNWAQRMILTVDADRFTGFNDFRGPILRKPVSSDALRSAVRACFALTGTRKLGRAQAT